MKRFLFYLCCLLCLQASATDYKSTFYEMLEESDFKQAEAILNQWEVESKEDPEVIVARFNLYVNAAHNEIIVLDNIDNASDLSLVFSDKEGNPVGVVRSEATWNDSLVNEAVKIIDYGIKLYPDRLDFRFGKASLYQFIEDWENFSATAVDVLNRAKLNNGKWFWTDNEALSDNTSINDMLEAIHEYERTLASNSNNEDLLNLNIKYYPNDHIALTLKGALAYGKGDVDKALEYMNRAHNSDPSDILIVCNLALLYKETKDIAKAKELYQSILDNREAESEWKIEAERMLKQIETE